MSLLSDFDIILASGSPRRRELLEMLGLKFRVDTSHSVDEIVPPGMAADEVPLYLSGLKADGYPIRPSDRSLVIAADTVVIIDGEVIGKPADLDEARAMLSRLSGRVHRVITGVTVRTAERRVQFTAESTVEFSKLTREEIDYYVDRFRPLDKAGAYGIQEWIGAAAIVGISGSFYNVMGLPVQRLYQVLRAWR